MPPPPSAPSQASEPPPILIAKAGEALCLTHDGEISSLSPTELQDLIRKQPPLLCHAPAMARKLGLQGLAGYDIMELFAFVRPARFAAPSPRGVAQALGLPLKKSLEDQAAGLWTATDRLLAELAAAEDPQALDLAFAMARAGWVWGPLVLGALSSRAKDRSPNPQRGLYIWEKMGEWSEHAPSEPPPHHPVDPEAARRRLSALLGDHAEARPQQADYASAASQAFRPRQREDEPNLVLAEAGTGVGKTLGYIAPASLWAEENHSPVWLATYTRNLQRQIDQELDRLYPRKADKDLKVVIRKGRENYLCLLNYAEAARRHASQPNAQSIALGLIARWARHSRDGDMVGSDFPGWLADLTGLRRSLALTDRRGECIYSACEFYRRCFIEKSIRRARRAELVVANHALVMIQAAMGAEEGFLPAHYVFDEGHHLFDAADSAFAAHLSGMEGQELRRWLLGAEGRRAGGGRQRGLAQRLEDLITDDDQAESALHKALMATRSLPSEGWHARLSEGRGQGPTEAFLLMVRQQVFARSEKIGEGYSLECDTGDPVAGLLEAAAELDAALKNLEDPLKKLADCLGEKLDQENEELDSDTRRRLDATAKSLQRRALMPLKAWRQMLRQLDSPTPEEFIDWFAVERIEGREIDIGYFRHWLDPLEPFAQAVLKPSQGVVITSATLTDRPDPEGEVDWAAAEGRSGAHFLANPAIRARVLSPFDYAAQTKVFIVNDVRKDDLKQVSAAFRSLFLASGGGALGLFTAISRLKRVYQEIAPEISQAGLDLLAQHLDGLDVSTLIEVFRGDPNSCLLGTDAVRDGVDVPGEALRLIVFDRVPWPRPSIAHRARRQAFGSRTYDDRITRLKLRQAYGRLVRRADDRGVFVLLDPMMPTRLTGAFPEGVQPERIGLAEAIEKTRGFLGET